MKKFVAAFMAALLMATVLAMPVSAMASAQFANSVSSKTVLLEEAQMQVVIGGDRDNVCLGAGILIGVTFFAPGGFIWAGYAGIALAELPPSFWTAK